MSEPELTFGQRVHITQRYVQKMLNYTLPILGTGIGLVVFVLLVGVPAVQFMESFGTYEYRLNSADGPECSPFPDSEGNLPAQISLMEGLGAEKAGLKDGDIIQRINDKEITNSKSLDVWAEQLPDVQPGDFIDVVVNRYGSELVFTVETTSRDDDPSKPLMGIITGTGCFEFFVLREDVQFTQSDMDLVILALWFVIIITAGVGIALVFVLFRTRSRIRDLKEELTDIENDYLDENYALAFATTIPTGKTDGEKIFNAVQNVFPELREEYDKFAKWTGKMKLKDGYEFDCYETAWAEVPTIFIAKHFGDETITLEKIQELCDESENSIDDDNVGKQIGDISITEVMRVVCVGRNYESKFLSDEKSLEKTMDELDFDGIIDLVFEKDGKYSIFYIDYE